MTNAEKFLYCLAMTESLNDDKAWGDNGQALGRWQVHPDRLFDEARRYGLYPFLNETWDRFIGRVLTEIYLHRTEQKYDALAIAQYWHLGHIAQVAEYDQEYSKRFNAYWNREMAAEPAIDRARVITMLDDAIKHLENLKAAVP